MIFMQILQIGGALLILLAFALNQAKRMDSHSVIYLLLNLAGASILAILAAISYQWGFLLLEGVWALVSAYGLFRALVPVRPNSNHPETLLQK